MVEFELNIKEIKEFLEVVTLKNDMKEVVLNFSEESLEMYNSYTSDNLITYGKLNGKFGKATIGLLDIGKFIDALSFFNNNVSLSVTENSIIIFDEEKHITLRTVGDLSTLTNNFLRNDADNKIQQIQGLIGRFTENMIVTKSNLNSIKKGFDFCNSEFIELGVDNNKMSVRTFNSNNKVEEHFNVNYRDCTTYLDVKFIKISQALISKFEDIEMSILNVEGNNRVPVMLSKKTDNMEFKMICSPTTD